MLIVLSPAKTIDFSASISIKQDSVPEFITEAGKLIKILQKFKPEDLSSLMGISPKLADLNAGRFVKWNKDHNNKNSKPAVAIFKGDVYIGLNAQTLDNQELIFLNQNLRILSGLYGVVKPFDLIQEYRLEMGTPLANPKGKDLYSFWGNSITKQIIDSVEHSHGDKVLVNLASNEYFNAINTKLLKCRIVTPVFKEFKDNEYKFVSFFAKKARGLMTRFIAVNQLLQVDDIKGFNYENYCFIPEKSTEDQWVFAR